MGELFEGFEPGTVPLADGELFYRAAGSGPPVALLHGYPQSHAMWHRVAPELTDLARVIAFDLPGYGRSAAPDGGPARYAKRRLASDVVEAMAALGHTRFAVLGHDRGGRVAYRLALDHPARVSALAVLDIVPTGELWARFDVARAMRFYHWLFLAQPAPLPEMLIGNDPVGFLELTMSRWTKAGDLSAFHPDALAAYREAFSELARIKASCEDYRAGATLDAEHDQATMAAGETIAAPTLVLWGASFAAGGGHSPLDFWRSWAPNADGAAIDAGHFVCEENAGEVVAALRPFLARHLPT